MAKKEIKTDLWVASQLRDSNIPFDAQGSNVKEIDEALKTASKRGTGNAGYPEYVAVVNDFVLVIEDKADVDKQVKKTEQGILDTSTKAVTDYAVNGAYFYAKHIAQNSNFKKVFAIGVSGDAKHHKITPVYVDDREGYMELEPIESFAMFSKERIQEYYTRVVLKEDTPEEKTTTKILADAAELHEYLRTYGSLKDQDKPLVVSGILLALDEIKSGSFSLNSLTGDEIDTDGDKIYEAIKKRLKRSNVGPDAKRDKLMSEFAIIRTSTRLNTLDETLGKTPLKYYAEFLKERVFDYIKGRSSSEDFIGRFYGEFMSYSGGDGQTLGIVLTPAHICELFCDLLDIQPDDIVLDPCCGTAGFLVAAMHRMVSIANSETDKKNIRKKQLHGYELQSNMFAIACTNMILRDDGNSNIWCQDFLKQNEAQVQLKGATVGMMNPPYSQGTKKDPSQYELSFVEHLLDSLTPGGRAAVIVPQS
ncbi:MAG: N-6 DNA methylase, partial [Acidaminococcaceae bacterium]|nr:N-6 DNA methylase [Acidaminococcaceae bacterium]